jgi:hypothetical protein
MEYFYQFIVGMFFALSAWYLSRKFYTGKGFLVIYDDENKDKK